MQTSQALQATATAEEKSAKERRLPESALLKNSFLLQLAILTEPKKLRIFPFLKLEHHQFHGDLAGGSLKTTSRMPTWHSFSWHWTEQFAEISMNKAASMDCHSHCMLQRFQAQHCFCAANSEQLLHWPS